MRQQSPSLGVLISFLMVGVLIISACAPQTSNTYQSDLPQLAQAIPQWEHVNPGGFGGTQTWEVTAMEAFNGYVYLGTHNPIDPGIFPDGAQVFRSADGGTWTPVTQPGFGNSHDIAPPAILDLVVFNNQLYAGTGRGNASQIWRSSNGTTWAPMDVTGFSDPDNVDVSALTVYGGKIYAGITNRVTGAQIWSSFTGDNNSWAQVAPTVPGTVPSTVTGFAVFSFDDGLYAAVESEAPVQIWRSYGADWDVIVNGGFGDINTTLSGGMIEFGGYLYVGAGNTTSGAQLWRTNDGAAWEQVISPGFGDQNNREVEAVFVFQNQLHVDISNAATGLEVWRWSDGLLWEQINPDGFGNGNNALTNASNATTGYASQLYVGTRNLVNGAELWRTVQQIPDTPTFTATHTATHTATSTATFTATHTATDTPTHTATFTSTHTLTFTPTHTPTFTPTHTLTFTPTYTPTDTSTFTPTPTATNTLTNTPTDTPTHTSTFTPTDTPEFTPTNTTTFTPTDTSTFTPTHTPTFTPTLTPTPTPLMSTPGKVTGGGVIGSNRDGVRITFGFTIQFDQGDPKPKGNLTYQDHKSDLRLKVSEFEALVIEGGQVMFTGIGTLNDGQEVTFTVEITALGDPERPDTFYIHIPALDGYESGGSLTGGHITIH